MDIKVNKRWFNNRISEIPKTNNNTQRSVGVRSSNIIVKGSVGVPRSKIILKESI